MADAYLVLEFVSLGAKGTPWRQHPTARAHYVKLNIRGKYGRQPFWTMLCFPAIFSYYYWYLSRIFLDQWPEVDIQTNRGNERYEVGCEFPSVANEMVSIVSGYMYRPSRTEGQPPVHMDAA